MKTVKKEAMSPPKTEAKPKEEDHGHCNTIKGEATQKHRGRKNGETPLSEEDLAAAEGFDQESTEWRLLRETEPEWLVDYLFLASLVCACYAAGRPWEWLTPNQKKNMNTFISAQRKMRESYYHATMLGDITSNSDQFVCAKITLMDKLRFPWNLKAIPPPDSASKEWFNYYQRLQYYVKYRGDAAVPSHTELGIWCNQMRTCHKNGTLTIQKKDALVLLGFDWDLTIEVEWNEMYKELVKFREEWGHTCVWPPGSLAEINSSPYTSLARWCQRQRVEYSLFRDEKTPIEHEVKIVTPEKDSNRPPVTKKQKVVHKTSKCEKRLTRLCLKDSTLTQDHIDKLNSLHFIWDTNIKIIWCQKYKQLQEHYFEHGHSSPVTGTCPVELSVWVGNLRHFYRKFQMSQYNANSVVITPTKLKLMELVEFEWVTMKESHSWDTCFGMLEKFHKTEGHFLVPESNRELRGWINYVRAVYLSKSQGSDHRLSEKKIKKLDSIGFIWKTRSKRENYVKFFSSFEERGEATSKTSQVTTNTLLVPDLKRNLVNDSFSDEQMCEKTAIHESLDVSEVKAGVESSKNNPNKSSYCPSKDKAHATGTSLNYISTEEPSSQISLEDTKQKMNSHIGQQTQARRSMLEKMKCDLCEGVMVRATGCIPCGHSFCESCIDEAIRHMGQKCPTCSVLINDTLWQHSMDDIILCALECGDFTSEEWETFRRRSSLPRRAIRYPGSSRTQQNTGAQSYHMNVHLTKNPTCK